MKNEDINKIDVVFEIINASNKEDYHLIEEIDILFIVRIIEKHTGMLYRNFKIVSRKREVVLPRQICMYFLTKYTNHSTPKIGSLFEAKNSHTGLNHTTVLHANKTIQNLIDTDKMIHSICDRIKKEIINYQNPALRGRNSKLTVFSELLNKATKDETEVNKWIGKYLNAI